MRDRLRAVECPSDIIDQIGGWLTQGVRASYGSGFQVDALSKWLSQAIAESNNDARKVIGKTRLK